MSIFTPFNEMKRCRHGMMLYNRHDTYIGRSLEHYGEFSEGEVELFRQMIKPGQVVVEVGANIGAHTLVLAQLVGLTGTVLAFEPQRIVYQTLCANMAFNSVTNVHCLHAAVGRADGRVAIPALDYSQENNFGGLELGQHANGEIVPVLTLDGLNLRRCDFLKVDVEGMEQDVLEGARRSIAALSPILYVENDRPKKSEPLIRFIDALDYKMYWHKPPLFNPNNFMGNPLNVFSRIVSLNMLCVPKRALQRVVGLEPVILPLGEAASRGGQDTKTEAEASGVPQQQSL